MNKWKIQVNGYERNSFFSELAICRTIIVEAETKDEAIQKAKISFISGKHGNYRLNKNRPIQYTRKINA